MRFFYRLKRRMGHGKFENGAKYKSVQPMLWHNIKIIRYIIWSYSNLKSIKFPKYSFHQMHCIWKLMALNKNILAYIYTAVFCWWAACWCTNYKLGANIFQAEHHGMQGNLMTTICKATIEVINLTVHRINVNLFTRIAIG